jgi:1,4-alpha-glucan branching enzyme
MSAKDKPQEGKRAGRPTARDATQGEGARDLATSAADSRPVTIVSRDETPTRTVPARTDPTASMMPATPSAAEHRTPQRSQSTETPRRAGGTAPMDKAPVSPGASSTESADRRRAKDEAGPPSTRRGVTEPVGGGAQAAEQAVVGKKTVAPDAATPASLAEGSIRPTTSARDIGSTDIAQREAASPVAPTPALPIQPTSTATKHAPNLEASTKEPSPAEVFPGLADAGRRATMQPFSPALPAKRRPGPAPVDYHWLAPEGEVNAVLYADHRDPFSFLGMHAVGSEGLFVVRAFLPTTTSVTVLEAATGEPVTTLERIREAGFFAGGISATERFDCRLRVTTDSGTCDIDDPYRFPPVLSETDVQLLAEGSHLQSYEKLGAHLTSVQGVAGVAFTVWAPHAGRVAVIGDFNDWDGRRHGMRLRHECGVWEIFLPGVDAGGLYKFEIKSSSGIKLIDKSDPCAFRVENPPGSAAIICDLDRHGWRDDEWMERRRSFDARRSPVAIYEVHLGSWRRKPEQGHRWLTYQEHADELVGYVADMGFTHLQVMPVSEFENDASMGYLPSALYAPTGRWGTPEQFQLLVDRCHQARIGVIVDWIPNQFSDAPHGLSTFDGTHLYEHSDPRQRRNPGSGALTYDYGRREVANYLTANALFWLDKYHLDALRVPAVETMLYLDYARARGEWAPNRFGGHENLEAIDFLRRLNEHVYALRPGAFTIAEENSAWQRVSHPTFVGGLGFGFRCDPGWVTQTLRYLSRNPVHRKYYHDELLQGPAEAFRENYILPLAHTEVAVGKGSMLNKMPGDRWQRFAQLRAYYALMYTHPGKKLLFMGTEFAQEREWNSEISLDWHELGDPMHLGVQRLVRDLNALYRATPALHEQDCEPEGFSWIDCNDSDQSVISFLRLARDGRGTVAVVCNFTPVARPRYRIGVPDGGFYQERLNSDAQAYGGANIGNEGGVEASAEPMHGRPFSLTLKLPPFATVVLEHKGRRPVG